MKMELKLAFFSLQRLSLLFLVVYFDLDQSNCTKEANFDKFFMKKTEF